MVYRIADLYIEIDSKYPYTKAISRDYLCDDPPRIDFSASVSEEEIAFERRESEFAGCRSTDGRYENMAIFRKVCAELLRRDGFMIHGALIEYEGKGYLFTAKSGTGKTTHVRLWQKAFGDDKALIVNGDKPLVRFLGGEIYSYGTPWCGKEGYNINKRVPLSGIVCLHRADENHICKISADEAFPFLMSQIMVTDSPDFAKQFELLGQMLERTPIYKLECNTDISAAYVAQNGLVTQKEERKNADN